MENTNKYDQIVDAIYKDPFGYIATLNNIIEDSNNRVKESVDELTDEWKKLGDVLERANNALNTDNK